MTRVQRRASVAAAAAAATAATAAAAATAATATLLMLLMLLLLPLTVCSHSRLLVLCLDGVEDEGGLRAVGVAGEHGERHEGRACARGVHATRAARRISIGLACALQRGTALGGTMQYQSTASHLLAQVEEQPHKLDPLGAVERSCRGPGRQGGEREREMRHTSQETLLSGAPPRPSLLSSILTQPYSPPRHTGRSGSLAGVEGGRDPNTLKTALAL